MRTLLVMLFFLSSAACVSAKPSELRYAEAVGKLDGRGGCGNGGIIGRFCLPFSMPSGRVFEKGAPAFRYYFRWPPVPSRADQLILEARARLMDLLSQKPPRELPVWPFTIIAFPGLLFTVVNWQFSKAK